MKTILLLCCLFFIVFSQAQTANPANPLLICEQNSDGYATFDLTTAILQILGTQNPANYNVSFHESTVDASNGINLPNPSSYNNVNPFNQTIYTRVEELTTGNFAISSLDLIVGETPETYPGGIVVCDDATLDGFTNLDLTQSESAILGSQNPSDFTITYYLSQSDAQNGTNSIAIPSNFTNTSNPQTIYVRVTDIFTSCFSTSSFLVNVMDCSANPATLTVCEQNTDGFAVFDLTVAIPQILGTQNPVDYNITFHETYANAQNDIIDITSPIVFNNTVAGTQTIYARMESVVTGNFSIFNVVLQVGEIPEANPFGGIVICDDSTLDGIAFFDLTLSETVILGSQNASDFTISYYLTQNDAQSGMNPTANATNFSNSSNPQTVYVRVTDATGCFSITSFPINVVDCSADLDNDLVATGDEDVNLDNNLANDDTDADTFRNFEDNDDDGDGTLTADEDYNNNGNPMDDDTNSNGIPDYLDAGVTFSVPGFLEMEFSLYPNPSNGIINLEFENDVRVENIVIFNLHGKTVKEIASANNTHGKITIDLSKLPAGFYLLSVITDDGIVVEKILIE